MTHNTPKLHLDFETFSEAELNDVGAYRYANDPSTEILCVGMALDDKEPVCLDKIWMEGTGDYYPGVEECLDALSDPLVLIYAHNAQFEIAVSAALLEKTLGIPAPHHSRYRCTAAMARRAALPHALGKLSLALNLEFKKDNRGVALIRKFSVLQKKGKLAGKRILPRDDVSAFQEFIEYNKQDVRAEREIHHRLSQGFELTGNALASFQLDIAINSRGLPVNLDGLRKAKALVDQETQNLAEEFFLLTGFQHTQNVVFLPWLKERGYSGANLQAATIAGELEIEDDEDPLGEITYEPGMTLEAVEALRIKKQVSYASVKKIPAMLDCAGPHDNRIRGALIWHGPTTGRWSSVLVQVQNLKRPTIDCTEEAYARICEGMDLEGIRLLFGPPIEVVSSCIRHFIHDTDTCEFCGGYEFDANEDHGMPCPACDGISHYTNKMLDADFSAIEARIVCWVAGQEDALEDYRNKVDRYVKMARVIYGIPVASIGLKSRERFVGKQCVLGCGFGMGPPKFRGTCENLGYHDLPHGLEHKSVKVFRDTHKHVVSLWYEVERVCKMAINRKGYCFKVRDKLEIFSVATAGMDFLFIRLPSGRKLAYPQPQLDGDRITFFGQMSKSKQWGRIDTYGGKLVENIVQGIAADLMANGAINAESAGFEIATLIHDEALSYYQPGQTVEKFVECLTALPAWADGLPVEAEGELVSFYKK